MAFLTHWIVVESRVNRPSTYERYPLDWISNAVLSKAISAFLIIAIPLSSLTVASTISRELTHKRKALTAMPLRVPQATGCPS